MPKNTNTNHLEKVFSNDQVLKSLYQIVYPFRVIGMLTGSVLCLVVAAEKQLEKISYLWIVFICFIWPHIAYLLAKFSKQPKRAEVYNLLIDCVLAGFVVGLIQFSLLPSAVIFMIILADRINVGIRKIPYKVIPFLLLGILLSISMFGLNIDVKSSFSVMLATLPLLIIHTVAISYNNYHLIRKVRKQNKWLSDLNQTDLLTKLDSRFFWNFKAKKQLKKNIKSKLKNQQIKQAIILTDIDYFKEINDQYGHITGDAVLAMVSDCIKPQTNEIGFCGRLGGDEFMIYLLHIEASELAEYLTNLLEKVRLLKIKDHPEISCSLSIGAVYIDNTTNKLSDWLEMADRSLYHAKQHGKNQWHIFDAK